MALFTVCGRPQPLFCLLHRDVAPFVRAAVERGSTRFFRCLRRREGNWRRAGVALRRVFCNAALGRRVVGFGDREEE